MYAVVGIPITVVCWSNIGDAMANAFRSARIIIYYQGFGAGDGACWPQTFLSEPELAKGRIRGRNRNQNQRKVGAGAKIN